MGGGGCAHYPSPTDPRRGNRPAGHVWTLDIEGEFLEKLWESLPNRVAAVLDARGWYTKY